jgi:hypothetical protein
MQARLWQIGERPQRIRTYLVLFALALTQARLLQKLSQIKWK